MAGKLYNLSMDVEQARSLSLARSKSNRTRALSAVDYRVPGIVPTLRQPKGMDCWITAITMLYSWRNAQSMSVDTVANQIGEPFKSLYLNNTGLYPRDEAALLLRTGMVGIYGQNQSIQGWVDLLRQYGPLIVSIANSTGSRWGMHARVLVRVHGGGNLNDTKMTVVDPGNGREYDEDFSVFLHKYEREVADTSRTRHHIIHWPAANATANSYQNTYNQAFSNINVRVQGTVAPLRQPKSMDCWITTVAMMHAWKNQQSISVADMARQLGEPYLTLFNNNSGLLPSQESALHSRTGMVGMYGQNVSVQTLADMLRDHGPLAINIANTAAPVASNQWGMHLRVLVSIQGDGSRTGTTLYFIDPADGAEHTELYDTFVIKFEREIREDRTTRNHIFYWPSNTAQSKSYQSTYTEQLGPIDDRFGQTPTAGAHTAWSALIRHSAGSVRGFLPTGGIIHDIANANGAVNLDYYDVIIDRLPTNHPTAASLWEHIRKGIGSFLDQSIATFEPLDPANNVRWLSSAPLGAVMNFNMMDPVFGVVNVEDAGVICSHIAADNWIFSTIGLPSAIPGVGNYHPVSGNRQFGFGTGDDGKPRIYTRAADRITRAADQLAIAGTIFSGGDRCWKAFLDRVIQYVTANGGAARRGTIISDRWNWSDINRMYP
jgi:hypothetical protein